MVVQWLALLLHNKKILVCVRLGPHCIEFACSPIAYMGSLCVLQESKDMHARLISSYKLAVDLR